MKGGRILSVTLEIFILHSYLHCIEKSFHPNIIQDQIFITFIVTLMGRLSFPLTFSISDPKCTPNAPQNSPHYVSIVIRIFLSTAHFSSRFLFCNQNLKHYPMYIKMLGIFLREYFQLLLLLVRKLSVKLSTHDPQKKPTGNISTGKRTCILSLRETHNQAKVDYTAKTHKWK